MRPSGQSPKTATRWPVTTALARKPPPNPHHRISHWGHIVINMGALVTPSMRTHGGEVVGGRWGRSLVDDSLAEAFPAAWVAVLVCCTALVRVSCAGPAPTT